MPPAVPAGTLRILGLDPGSRRLGYALVDTAGPGRFTYLECGYLRVDPRRDVAARLVDLGGDLRRLIAEFRPTCAAVEDVFVRHHPRSALILGQARGAVLLVAGEAGLAITSYPPATVKRAICGNGRAPKEQVQRMVATLAGLRQPPAPDAADALAVALCHCLQLAPGTRARAK